MNLVQFYQALLCEMVQKHTSFRMPPSLNRWTDFQRSRKNTLILMRQRPSWTSNFEIILQDVVQSPVFKYKQYRTNCRLWGAQNVCLNVKVDILRSLHFIYTEYRRPRTITFVLRYLSNFSDSSSSLSLPARLVHPMEVDRVPG